MSSPDLMKGWEEIAVGVGTPILLSSIATVVRIMRYGWKGVKHFIASVSTSIFVGVLVSWSLDYFELKGTVCAAIISLCAYMSGTLLDSLVFRAKKVVQEGSIILPGKTSVAKKP